ncbi:hypothetical protein ES703_22940 [subsurface metagenome]
MIMDNFERGLQNRVEVGKMNWIILPVPVDFIIVMV